MRELQGKSCPAHIIWIKKERYKKIKIKIKIKIEIKIKIKIKIICPKKWVALFFLPVFCVGWIALDGLPVPLLDQPSRLREETIKIDTMNVRGRV